MNIMLRTGALALALLVGTALTTAPAMAGRGHHDRWNDKSWSKPYHGKYAYKKHRRKHHYGRKHRGGKYRYGWDGRYRHHRHGWRGHRRPAYGWFYGGPGFSIHIR